MVTTIRGWWHLAVAVGTLTAWLVGCGQHDISYPTSATPIPLVQDQSPTTPVEPVLPGSPVPTPLPPAIPPSPAPVTTLAPGAILTGAGDIGDCGTPGAALTARLLTGTIIALGDFAYPHGSKDDFRNCYDSHWGSFRDRTFPSPGNHDYETDNAVPYFEYFGTRVRGPEYDGYYSYTLGGWQILSLNSELGRAAMDRQLAWIVSQLTTNPTNCTLAYFHRPLFSSGVFPSQRMRFLWERLYRGGVDLIVNAHEHFYERFAPQDPIGTPDPVYGISQLTVGTGGGRLFEAASRAPNSEKVIVAWGVIKLSLRPTEYDWEFLPAEARGASDFGTRKCHPRPPGQPR